MSYGHVAWEIVRRHPDWFVLGPYGRPVSMPADPWVDLLDQWRTYDVLADIKSGKYHGSYWVPRGYPDHRRLDTIDYAIDEVVGSARIFGWDGVRFDSSGFRAHYIDGTKDGRDGVNIRSMKRLKKRVWEALPNFLIGHNTRIPPYLAKDGRAYPLDPGDSTGHEFREALAGGGLWMGEGFRDRQPRNGKVRYKTWSKLARDELRCIRTIKHYGGHFFYSYGTGRGGKAEDIYRFMIGTMIGAHQYGNEHVTVEGSEQWGQFLTRWSGFFWGERLRALKDVEDAVSVKSARPLWWKEFANERIVSPTRRYVIVNLLNPPVNDEIAKTKDELPKPVADATVRLAIGRGEKLAKVFFLSPGLPNRAERLTPRRVGKGVAVRVPTFDTWAMVVWELKGKFQVPKSPPRFTEPMSREEIAELANWEDKRVKINVADNLMAPTPQHDPAQVKAKDFAKATPAVPEGLRVGGQPGLDILVFKGLHHYAYRIADAVKTAAPKARITQITGRAKDMPKGHRGFFGYDIIILADYGDGLSAEAHRYIADFVRAGGKLLVLGGIGCLGQGFYKSSPIEAVLPVTVRAARDIYRAPKPLPLGKKRGAAYRGRPLLYYFHAVKPRADARALMWAGELPVLWRRSVGKGKSLVFVGTALGEAQKKGETPFWEWDRWPETLGEAIVQ